MVLTDKTLLWDREKDLKFKTPSGKIELVSSLMEKRRLSVLAALYAGAPRRSNGDFKLMVGRTAAHTHVSTQNNLYLVRTGAGEPPVDQR